MERKPTRRSSSGKGKKSSRKPSRSDSSANESSRSRGDKPNRFKSPGANKRKRHSSHAESDPVNFRRKTSNHPKVSSLTKTNEHQADLIDKREQNRDDLIFGRHTVVAAMEHERPLNKVWVVSRLKRNSKISDLLIQAKVRGAVIEETSQLRLDQLTQYATHQGIVAQVGACQYIELDELITTARATSSDPVLIAVDGITDPHNLGAIIRSAEAMGAQGLVLPQRRSASVGATVAKVAAGALETLPIARVINLNQALETLKQENFWVYGLTLDAEQAIHQVALSGAVVLLIGSEGKGLSAVTQKHCDQTVRIPLAGDTQSLNASVAAGIGVYEIFRQRQK